MNTVSFFGSDKLRIQEHLFWIPILAIEVFLLGLYFILNPDKVEGSIYFLQKFYPIIWINTGLWTILHTHSDSANTRHRLVGLAIALAYFFVVMFLSGYLKFSGEGSGFFLNLGLAPGFSPLISYNGAFYILIIPFEAFGYITISYLLYSAVLMMTRGVFAGVLGIGMSIGCCGAVLIPLLLSLGGTVASITTTAIILTWELKTISYLLTISLLYASCHPEILRIKTDRLLSTLGK